jgi:hypothetical protein
MIVRTVVLAAALLLASCAYAGTPQLPTSTATATTSPSARTTAGALPSKRAGAALVYVPAAGGVVLVGGDQDDETGKPAKLHAWDGKQWRVIDAGRPEARSLAGVAFDADRSALVVYGGSTGVGRDPHDTWEWAAGAWTQRAQTGPAATSHMGTVYEAARHRVLLFGGNDDRPVLFGETWSWDGATWTKLIADGRDRSCTTP